MGCGVGHRRDSDLALLWLWLWPAAVASIGPLAWEPPYSVLKRQKKPKKQTNKQTKTQLMQGVGVATLEKTGFFY